MLQELLRKDFLLLFRSPQRSLAILLFSLVLVVIASFAFRRIGYGQAELRDLTPGILWLIYLFVGVTALNYAFVPEQENDALRGLLLTSIDPGLLFFSKFLANYIFIVAIQSIACIAHVVFFGVHLELLPLIGLVFLVTVGFAALGTILSAVSTAVSGREILLPVVLFPLCVPMLAGAITLTRVLLESQSFPLTSFWFLLVVVFDVVSFALSLALFEYVLRE